MIKKNALIKIVLIAISTGAAVVHADTAQIEEAINALNPEVQVQSVTASPLANIMEVKLTNGEYIYVSSEAGHVLTGRLLAVENGEVADLTAIKLNQDRQQALAAVDLDQTITYPSRHEDAKEVFVFTDTSCPYCQRFHSHIAAMNEAGITVHYLAFPRGGAQSPVLGLMDQAWCAEAPQEALTEAKATGEVHQDQVPCVSPVMDQFRLGQRIGVSGTPAIYDAEGRSLGGYLNTEQLVSALQ